MHFLAICNNDIGLVKKIGCKDQRKACSVFGRVDNIDALQYSIPQIQGLFLLIHNGKLRIRPDKINALDLHSYSNSIKQVITSAFVTLILSRVKFTMCYQFLLNLVNGKKISQLERATWAQGESKFSNRGRNGKFNYSFDSFEKSCPKLLIEGQHKISISLSLLPKSNSTIFCLVSDFVDECGFVYINRQICGDL